METTNYVHISLTEHQKLVDDRRELEKAIREERVLLETHDYYSGLRRFFIPKTDLINKELGERITELQKTIESQKIRIDELIEKKPKWYFLWLR